MRNALAPRAFRGRGGPRTSHAPLACVVGQYRIDLVRALALDGIRCAAVTPADDSTRASRFVTTSIDWVDHWTRPAELVERLVRFAGEMPLRPVLFYQSDGDMLAVSRYRQQLSQAFDFVVPDEQVVETALDKAAFYRAAERHDIPVPRTVHIKPGGELGNAVDLPFPVVVKLAIRRHSDWASVAGHAKAMRAGTPDQLSEMVASFAEAGLAVLVQESIPGPESRVESYHAYVDEHGERVAEFTGRKIRTLPLEYGESTALETTAAADVRELGQEVVMALGVRGVCKVDFKRTPRGELKVLEINPRFNLWHHLGAVAGVNLPALVYADLTGRPRPRVSAPRAGVRWCDWTEDRHAARQQGLAAFAWARWLLAVEAKSGLWWDDPMPFVRHHLMPAVTKRLSRPVRRARRKY